MKFLKILESSITNIWRNKFLSSATIMIIALILFTFNVILSMHLIANSGLNNLQKKVDIILYLKDSAEPIKVAQFIEELKTIPSVKEVIYTSKEEALRNLLNKYPVAINPFSKYGIQNPLPVNINIITTNAKYHNDIFNLTESNKYISLFLDIKENSANQKIISQLLQLTENSEKILISTLIIFLVASILIISNAITLSIYHKKEELNIMKLVGAAPNAIRNPFIIEGVFYGFTGFIISIILLIEFLYITNLDLLSSTLNANIYKFVIIELFACVIIGIISSIISTQKYINLKK